MSAGRPSRPLPSLRFRRVRALALLVTLILLVTGAVHLVESGLDQAPLARELAVSGAAQPAAAPTSSSAAAELDRTAAASSAGTAGRLAVAVTDLSTGVSTTYGPAQEKFVTASIVKVDILATLLLQHKGKMSTRQRAAARQMIEQSSNGAASTLWRQIGKAAGLARANRQFGLTATVGGKGGYWGQTTTTATDQQRLLQVVFTDDSPLDQASRTYLQTLMGRVVPDQDWGVSAADTRAGAKYQVKNGWLPRSKGWIVNSVGSVDHHGHQLLIVTLSDHQRSKAVGITIVERVSKDAARAVSGV